MKAKNFAILLKKNCFTKKNEIRKGYYLILSFLFNVQSNNKIHFVHNRNKVYESSYDKYTEVLSLLEIDYIVGNDAPKGGKLGDYIQITKKGIKRLEPFINEYNKAKHTYNLSTSNYIEKMTYYINKISEM